MFESSIERILQFTRPIHTISRTYGGMIIPGSSTLFFVNNKAVAITCKHVLSAILGADHVNQVWEKFKLERNKLPRDNKFKRNLQGLELKYQYTKDTVVQVKHNFLNAVDKFSGFVSHSHATLDLAILEFTGFEKTYYDSVATFIKDNNNIKPGKYLCRVGYPFPEFSNYKFNAETDDIEWTSTGNQNSPFFPIDGIMTRYIGDQSGITGIELSTPGLRGQSGGPLFDVDGRVYGMQFATNHLHLGFDLKDREILHDGKKAHVSNYPFLHVGLCIHADRIKQFLTEHNIEYKEA